MEPLHSPLHDEHTELGAKFAPFGGWDMPLEYAGGGVLAEHTVVRDGVGVFDVSHLGKALVRGPGAIDYVNSIVTNDLNRIGTSQAQYTLLCDPAGGVIDDLIAYRVSDFEVFLIPNAANTTQVVQVLQADAPEGIEVTNQHRDYAVLAVQGPQSSEVLAAMGLTHGQDYMAFADDTIDGVTIRVCRTGYTGELGYELVVAADQAPGVWERLFSAGEPFGIRACGLGARDTLRTEMGYALHGHELSLDINPVMANVGWAVGWNKADFHGKAALETQRAEKTSPILRGLRAVGRGIPRPDMAVSDESGPVGTVTSGTFSPTLRAGIALALLDRRVTVGSEVTVDIRGRAERFAVVAPPFVDSNVR